jgi:predicted 3-demethylubiquinone-9 3-methyltransferase (glyoxalase superfamily)
MSKITPCLWFDGKAEEAANFYVSLLPDSRIDTVQLTIEFTLAGQPFLGLNGGPEFAFTEATSFIINCDDQAEVDRLWDALTKGGQPIQCGWLKDRYGLSWQITPTELPQLLKDPDPEKARRVMEAMMGMIKIDVAALRRAYGGTAAAEEDR